MRLGSAAFRRVRRFPISPTIGRHVVPPFLLVSLGFRRFVRHVGNGWRVVHAVRRKAEINPREYNFEYSFKSGIHTIRAFSVFFQGVRLQWQLVSDEALNLNQPVKDMGPNELKAYARLGKQQHDEANRELERRWRSYDDMLPNDQFVSIIDKTEG